MARTRSSDASITCRSIAAAQHGLLTREQAFAAGLARWALDDEISRGTWVPVRAGVYRSATAAVSWHQRALAACIGKTRAIAVSHRSAAFLHGVLAMPPSKIEVVTGYNKATEGLSLVARVHRVRREPLPEDIESVSGIPVTSLVRTLADLAGQTPPAELVELVDRAVRARQSEAARRRLVRGLEQAVPGRRGAASLRDALQPWTAGGRGSPPPQSVLEAKVLRVLARSGVPAPALQHEVVLPSGDRCYLDFAWPASTVALEVDGYAFHSDRRSFSHDRQRGNQLLVQRWQVLHTTWDEVRRNPERLVQAVCAALQTVAM
jgi:predicted transcriptional regulator of viral defense system